MMYDESKDNLESARLILEFFEKKGVGFNGADMKKLREGIEQISNDRDAMSFIADEIALASKGIAEHSSGDEYLKAANVLIDFYEERFRGRVFR